MILEALKCAKTTERNSTTCECIFHYLAVKNVNIYEEITIYCHCNLIFLTTYEKKLHYSLLILTGQNWGLSGLKIIWPVMMTGDLLSVIFSPVKGDCVCYIQLTVIYRLTLQKKKAMIFSGNCLVTIVYRVTTICRAVIYRFDCNCFSSEMKPSKCPGKEKKNGAKLWRIHSKGPGGLDSPFHTWRLFETEILTSIGLYIAF